jgi:hypothetical protein
MLRKAALIELRKRKWRRSLPAVAAHSEAVGILYSHFVEKKLEPYPGSRDL